MQLGSRTTTQDKSPRVVLVKLGQVSPVTKNDPYISGNVVTTENVAYQQTIETLVITENVLS